jgi:hypothetical protein
MQKTSYSGANVCIYANATHFREATVIGKKQYYWWKFMGYKTIPGRLDKHNRSKNKRTKIDLKIIRPYRKYPLVESVNLIKNKNIKLLLKLEGNNPGGSLKIVLPTT